MSSPSSVRPSVRPSASLLLLLHRRGGRRRGPRPRLSGRPPARVCPVRPHLPPVCPPRHSRGGHTKQVRRGGFFPLLSFFQYGRRSSFRSGIGVQKTRFSAIHFQGWFIRQVSCYTLLSGFQLPWPPSCCQNEPTPFMGSVISVHLGTATQRLVHPTSPVLLTRSGPLKT